MKKIKRYDMFELNVNGENSVTVFKPDGTKVTVFAFDKQEIHMEYDEEGIETAFKDGAVYKAVRIFPEQCGIYKIKGNTVDVEFEVIKGENHGYIKVSTENPKYLAFSDNTPFFPIGINLAFPSPVATADGNEFGVGIGNKYLGMRQYERWFKQCAENGVNMARIWLGHEYFCVDTKNVGEYDLVAFSKIDMLIALAEKYGIRLKLTLEQFRYFDYERNAGTNSYSDDVFRKFNKNLYADGKRCNSVAEWLTEDVWKNAWLCKVSELAKRISGNTTVFAIELWNEMNSLGRQIIVPWNREMLPKVKEIFKNHLVINSLGSFDSEWAKRCYNEFCWECSDIKQMHRYLDQGAEYEVCHGSLIGLLADGIRSLDDEAKPFLVSETGAVNNCHSGPFKYYSFDHKGILFCDAVFTPVFCGSCGVGNIWHWDDRYVEAKNLYGYFKPIAELTENVDFIKEKFKPEIIDYDNVIMLLLRGENTAIGYIRNKSYNWQTRLRDLSEAIPVKELTVSGLGYKSAQKIDIWSDETATVSFSDNKLTVQNITCGLFVKLQ